MNVLVTQRGARHRYAIPRMFQEAGMLAALYTDSTAYSTAGRVARKLFSMGGKPSSLGALASRVPEGIPPKKVYSSDRPLVSSLLKGMPSPDLDTTYEQWGLRGAEVVYSMYGEDFGFLEWAKAQGAKIVVDVFVHPETNRIVAEETDRCLGTGMRDPSAAEREDLHSRRTFELADILLCPSSWVAGGVREFSPESAGKIRIVPYGSSLNVRDSINMEPEAGRLLFAGREPLRKGLHHLAAAASLVRQSGTQLDVRAAGVAVEDIGWIGHKAEINCLGTLPMGQMHREFEQADVFVFPSLSEGQAGVVLEAMACGCPVIATRESGVDFLPESGVTVPVGNPEALAEAIRDVVGNRNKRMQLARGALHQAASFSMEAWKNRLIEVSAEATAQAE